MQYKVPFMINQCFTNGMVTLQGGEIKLGIIHVTLNHIYLIQTLRILTLKNMYDDVNILSPVLYFVPIFNINTEV